MGSLFRFTDSMLADLISYRLDGYDWDSVSRKLNRKYKIDKSSESVRWAYRQNKHLFDLDDKTCNIKRMKEISRVQNRSTILNKQNRKLLNYLNTEEDLMHSIKLALDSISYVKPYIKKIPQNAKGRPLTLEILFSDWQIGKLMDDYSSPIARRRLQEFTRAILFKIDQYIQLGYKIEKIIIPMLGDIIESSEKHKNSARATDCSTPAQMQKAIHYIHIDFMMPIANLGIPTEVFCITGNHDWNDHGINMYRPGEEHYSWVIYNTLKLLNEAHNFKHIKYIIAEGCFLATTIYKHHVIYEHGVGVKVTYQSMQQRMERRAQQIAKHVTYYRMGDKHNISRFNEDTLVCNGAFFGHDTRGVEFSGIIGFNAYAGQIMFAYTPRTDDRLPMYDSFIIQLQHIK